MASLDSSARLDGSLSFGNPRLHEWSDHDSEHGGTHSEPELLERDGGGSSRNNRASLDTRLTRSTQVKTYGSCLLLQSCELLINTTILVYVFLPCDLNLHITPSVVFIQLISMVGSGRKRERLSQSIEDGLQVAGGFTSVEVRYSNHVFLNASFPSDSSCWCGHIR